MAKREVGVTLDYKKFKFFKENRDVDSRHLAKLIKNIEKRNLLQDMPIIVDKEFYVIDGQTRLAAAKELQIPIYYTIAKKAEREDIVTLNMQSKVWTIADWLKYYCSNKNSNYTKFRKFLKDTNLSIPNGLSLFGIYRDRRNIFKNGEFEYPKDDSFQRSIMDQFDEWEELFDNARNKRVFLSAIVLLNSYAGYDPDRMLKKMIEKLKLKNINLDLNSREEVIILLNEIYNDRMGSNLVYFPRNPGKNYTKKV